jgi:hypothetical protein
MLATSWRLSLLWFQIAKMNPSSSGATTVAGFLWSLPAAPGGNTLTARLLSHFDGSGRFVANPEVIQKWRSGHRGDGPEQTSKHDRRLLLPE